MTTAETLNALADRVCITAAALRAKAAMERA